MASHFGGTRNALALSWPKGIAEAGGLRTQFHHVIDLAPTILEAAGIPHPASVNGVSQEPIEGTSMAYSFTDATAPSTHRTQYFEILANRGIYHEGWMASCFHGRVPWQRSQDLPIDGPQEHWELFDLASDFSQSVDLAFQHPDKLSELRGLFDAEARRYQVYPLSGETTSRALPFHRPSLIAGRRTFTYYPENVRMPEMAVVNMKNRDFDLVAHLEVPEGTVEGVVMCQGGNMAGWSLYVRDGRPIYHYNWLGHEQYVVESPRALPAGEVALRARFDYDEHTGLGKGGMLSLFIDDEQVGQGRIDKTVPFIFSMSGETMDVGTDTGAPVGPYPHEFTFTGTIRRIDVTVGKLLDALPEDKRDELLASGMGHAAMASQ